MRVCLSGRPPCHPYSVGGFAVLAARVGLLAGGAVLGAHAQAQVYVGESANGTVVLSYQQSAESPDLLVKAEPVAPRLSAASASQSVGRGAPEAWPLHVPVLPERYKNLIKKVASDQQVPAHLIAAVAAAESGFNARAVSRKGAAGLMQLMPETARRFNVNDRLSAEQSVRGGAAYLRWLSEHFANNLELVIAAYNAGENAVDQAGGMPNYPETQAYLPRVLGYLQHFKRLFQQDPA